MKLETKNDSIVNWINKINGPKELTFILGNDIDLFIKDGLSSTSKNSIFQNFGNMQVKIIEEYHATKNPILINTYISNRNSAYSVLYKKNNLNDIDKYEEITYNNLLGLLESNNTINETKKKSDIVIKVSSPEKEIHENISNIEIYIEDLFKQLISIKDESYKKIENIINKPEKIEIKSDKNNIHEINNNGINDVIVLLPILLIFILNKLIKKRKFNKIINSIVTKYQNKIDILESLNEQLMTQVKYYNHKEDIHKSYTESNDKASEELNNKLKKEKEVKLLEKYNVLNDEKWYDKIELGEEIEIIELFEGKKRTIEGIFKGIEDDEYILLEGDKNYKVLIKKIDECIPWVVKGVELDWSMFKNPPFKKKK